MISLYLKPRYGALLAMDRETLLTRRELGYFLGLSDQTIRKWEKSGRLPQPEHIAPRYTCHVVGRVIDALKLRPIPADCASL